VRTTLSRYAPVAPDQWAFAQNEFGRPEIANDDAAARRVSFNLSHTRNLIVLGVTCDNALGVDVENVHVRRAACEVADRFFSPVEVASLRALPPELQHQRFFEYWTLKESYIKARGMGLSIPLDQFDFNFQGDKQVSLSVSPGLNDRAARWRFWQFRPSAQHLAALCVERSDHSAQQLEIRKVVPFLTEDSIECPILRTSD
jgi:4'-phosphopantetheinyl transferase